MNTRRIISRLGIVLLLIVVALAVYAAISFKRGAAEIDKEWSSYKPPQIHDFGSTKTLSVLPLVNWHTKDSSLKGEAGVSYLIKTDTQTILFDVGFNKNNESPSPIEHNMQALGVSLEDIDTVFLSHAHLDHSGGQQWVNQQTFSMGREQADLSGKAIYASTPTYYPNNEVSIIPDPTIIGTGIASLGAISRQLAIGRIEEQALVINVEGKGLVIIVGCGHQTVPKIFSRAEDVFDENIYGLVGDLHYPLPDGRLTFLGINLQRFLASGEGPHSPITTATMEQEIAMLKRKGLKTMALGGHDTSDQVIDYVSKQFGDGYHHVKVGGWINISE
jgi:7,8-dihydropterin-6-yl-methyl-4-(beta-D-ribofuranosyl)aminobenzene 5'-phosphate synthase